MTQDEIIEMARQAGLDPDLWNYTDAFETFARLVEAKEREECAKVCESLFDLEDDTCDEAEKCASAIRARGQA